MKTVYNSSNYDNYLKMTTQDAKNCSHSGDCEADVKEVMKKTYIKNQLTKLDPEKLAKELKEYGAWNEDELKDHEQNLIRWTWISAGDITENKNN